MNEQKYKEIIDGHGQVLEEAVLRLESLENREYPDYRQATVEINVAVATLLKIATDTKAIVTSIPKSIATEHIHKVDFKGKKIIFVLAGAALAVFLCLIWIVNLYAQISELSEQALKYRSIRQVYPVQSDWADSIYRVDPDNMEKATKQLEEQSEASSHARDIAEQKYREAQEAKKEAKQLEKVSAHSRKNALHSK